MKFSKFLIIKAWPTLMITSLLVSASTFTGCVTVPPKITEMETGNKNITVENMLKINKGSSTTDNIKTIFGEPDSILPDKTNGTTTWVYVYTQTKQRNQDRVPFQIDQTQLEVVFNPKGIVIEYTQTFSNKTKRDL